jgi:hypothetical protein
VDGNWINNHTAATETDEHGNVNNVLHPHDLTPHPSSHTMSSAAPTATTAALAGQVPKEVSKDVAKDLPGSFPETPAAEPSSFSVNPIPATDGPGNPIHLAPGEKVPDPSTLTSNTITSTVNKGEPDAEPEAFGVKPIPATAGTGNPVHLAPGEKVPDPSTISGNSITSAVTTDKESYENGPSAAILPTNTSEKGAAETGMFGVPPVTKNMIPESSLPMGSGSASEADPGVTIQSSSPQSTTAALAGQVPLEPKGVPSVVTESQKEAHVDPEASASSEAVKEKSAVEEELKKKVHEEPATTESGLSSGGIAGAVTGGIAAAGAAAAGVATLAKGKTAEATGAVPDIVKESISKAHTSPEAAANPEAVKEKDAMEAELEKKIKPTNATGESAPSPGPAGGLSEDALSSPEPLTSSSEPKLNAPAEAPATAATLAPATPTKPIPSRDVSPKGGPAVTTGISTTAVPAESGPATPKKDTVDTPASKETTETSEVGTPDSKADKEKKKKHRGSMFIKKLKKIFD